MNLQATNKSKKKQQTTHVIQAVKLTKQSESIKFYLGAKVLATEAENLV